MDKSTIGVNDDIIVKSVKPIKWDNSGKPIEWEYIPLSMRTPNGGVGYGQTVEFPTYFDKTGDYQIPWKGITIKLPSTNK